MLTVSPLAHLHFCYFHENVHQTISYFYFHEKYIKRLCIFIFIKIVHQTIFGGSEDGQKAFAVLVLFAVTLGHEFSQTIHE